MANSYPTSKNNFLTGGNSQSLNTVGHAEEHNALETKLGIDNSTDPSSIDYILKNTASKNPGHYHTNGGSVLLVAASNAPTFIKHKADYVCTGANDDVTIQLALAALPSNGGIVELSEGTFTVAATIIITGYQRLRGKGVQATIVQANTDILIIRMGNRQADGIMRNWMGLEDMQVNQNNGTQTHTNVLMDGGGRGSSIKRVQTEGGYYGFELMDLDRCYFEDMSGTSPQKAAIFLEVGIENTYGTTTFVNCDTSLGYNNTYGIYVAANADQASPNAPDRINFIGCMMYMSNGLTGCIGFYQKIQMTATNFIGCLFEQNLVQYRCDGAQSQVSFLGCSFLDSNNVATDVAYLNSSGTFTFRDCRFQQATNCFHAVSGSPILCLEGKNDNQGNLTNLLVGSFASKMGTDTVFIGSGNLVSGLDNQPYATVFTQKLSNNGNGMQIGVNNADKLGFYGVTQIVRPLLATGATHTVDDVITTLQNLGLVKQS